MGPGSLMAAKGQLVLLGAQTASHITKDVLLGPYPKTAQEPVTIAKKYNMGVEDYQPVR